MRPTIAILFHARQRDPRPYLISSFAEIWRAVGIEVVYLFGIERFVPADVLIVHVDLSVVPEDYLAFAGRYPVVLNGEVADVRKSSVSQLRVGPESNYDGPVIVKTDLNYGGFPERSLLSGSVLGRAIAKLGPERPRYRLYERLDAVPDRFFARDFVVEKFLPEFDEGRFHIRNYYFLGDRYTCERFSSGRPIVRARHQGTHEQIEPDPAILEARRRLRLDYGKLDYVVHDGQPLLLDVNKTVGGSSAKLDRVLRSRLPGHVRREAGRFVLDGATVDGDQKLDLIVRSRLHRASGIDSYLTPGEIGSRSRGPA